MANSTTKTNSTKARKTAPRPRGAPRKAIKNTSGAQNVLNFALFFEQASTSCNVPRKRLLTMSGVRASTFLAILCNLKKKGLITYNKDTVQLTKLGRAKAKPVSALPDNASAQKDIKTRFKLAGRAAVLFDQLADGNIHDRHAIVGGLGFQSKNSGAVMLCNLRKTGILDYDKTTVKLTDLCFPFGRSCESN